MHCKQQYISGGFFMREAAGILKIDNFQLDGGSSSEEEIIHKCTIISGDKADKQAEHKESLLAQMFWSSTRLSAQIRRP